MNILLIIALAAAILGGILRLFRPPAPEEQPESYSERYRKAIQVQEQKGLLAGIRFMRRNGPPGDYLRYLIDRARWAAARSERDMGVHNLKGLDNLSRYMDTELPDGVYNYQVAAGIEDYCLRIIANADPIRDADAVTEPDASANPERP